MQQREIIAMIDARRVQGIGNSHDLTTLADKYPYCSTFQVLKAIDLKEQDSIDFKAQLNRAAIAIQDRSKLYDYIVKENLLSRIQMSTSDTDDVVITKQQDEIPPQLQSVEGVLPDAKNDILKTKNSSGTPEQIPDEKSARFKTEVLEDQIMREAIAHLGEIESDMRLAELNLAPEPEKLPEPDKSIDEEPLSFGAWLLQKDSPKGKTTPAERQIIDRFIQESPQISPVKTAFFSPSQMGKMSLVEDESFVTETLAKIYERQGDYKKAAKAYKNLKLKFPEKSIYFADLEKKAADQIK